MTDEDRPRRRVIDQPKPVVDRWFRYKARKIGAAVARLIELSVRRIAKLLDFHEITLIGTEDKLWVTMSDPKTGKVSATLVGSI